MRSSDRCWCVSMSQIFAKANRIRTPREYKRVLESEAKCATRQLVMIVRSAEAAEPRLGLIVSRKIGNAVVRNRIKRQIREAFRKNKESYAGLDVVVIARQFARGAKSKQLSESMQYGVRKAKSALG